MMQFSINPNGVNDLFRELDNKFQGIASIQSESSKENFARASFTILSKEFIRRTSILANANPKVYHHVYEWGEVGKPTSKLFILKRASVSSSNLRISSSFLDSKKRAPIDKILQIPGKNGRIVTKSSIFKKKAEVMESGKSTRPFSAKNAKALAFVENGKISFIKRPNSRVIRYPGGKQAVGAFDRQFNRWFGNPKNIDTAINKSGMLVQIERGVAKVLNIKGAGKNEVLRVVKDVTNAHSMGVKVL